MEIKERKLRNRQLLKDSIITAAKDIATDEGWNAVTMRKVAQKIDYTAPIIYEYFADKDELLQEIRREGYQKLLAKYQTAFASSDSPTDILTQIGIAYLDFAWENLELYTAMYCIDHSAIGIKGLENEIEQIRELIKNALTEALKNSPSHSALTALELTNNIDILRSLLHGTITLSMMGALQGDQARSRALALQGVQDLVSYWMKE